MKNMSRLRLNSTSSVNRLLARTINSLIDETISESNARAIGYLAGVLLKGLTQGDLEERLESLENAMEERKAG